MTKSFLHYTTIPSHLMDIVEEDLSAQFDANMQISRLYGNNTDLNKRNSKNAWVPTAFWVGGLMWNYFKKANDEFFHYDLERIDSETMQYTHYGNNEKYDWHQDEGLSQLYKPQSGGNRQNTNIVNDLVNESSQKIRKLSCVLQLSDSDDFEGGLSQIRDVDNALYTVPRERGTLVFFDSRLSHRAKMITKGLRKSLICWAIGPRWQ